MHGVAVVTGASRGLGREIALALGRQGYRIALNYIHSEKEASDVVLALGEPAIALKADVGILREVETMAGIISNRWGRIDAVINNAGIARDGLLIKYREEDWDEVVNTNLKGCFNTTKAFVPLMIKAGGGQIVNISSYSGLKGKAGQSAYSASKAALLGLTYTLARELAEYNIRVNALLPGYMPTDMGLNAMDAMKKASEESLLKKLSEPQDIAQFISYLLTTSNITGQVFNLDGRI
ncbi:MAG: 3-oxoacyl-ACP reductase family protein [Nitrospirota bacterium]